MFLANWNILADIRPFNLKSCSIVKLSDLAIPLIFWNLLLLSLFHAIIAITLAVLLKRSKRSIPDDQDLPPVMVILCLKGDVSYGLNCLRGLLNLNYPRYGVQVIADHPTSTAWQMLSDVLRDPSEIPVSINSLDIWHTTHFSFECSALIQTISHLKQDYKVVAMIDAGLIPHRDWLKELVSPLVDSSIGVTTGYRWYRPSNGQWSSLLRYAWNGFMVVQMCISRVPWEGSFALKIQHIYQINLVDNWRKTATPDIFLGTLLQEQGLCVSVVPSLLMTRHINLDILEFVDWIKQRLLLLRVYHPLWLLLAAQGVFVTFTLSRASITLLSNLLTGQWSVSNWIIGGLMVYLGAVTLLIGVLERQAQVSARQRGELLNDLPIVFFAKILIVIPIAQLFHGIVTVSTMFVRQLELRANTIPNVKKKRRILPAK